MNALSVSRHLAVISRIFVNGIWFYTGGYFVNINALSVPRHLAFGRYVNINALSVPRHLAVISRIFINGLWFYTDGRYFPTGMADGR